MYVYMYVFVFYRCIYVAMHIYIYVGKALPLMKATMAQKLITSMV